LNPNMGQNQMSQNMMNQMMMQQMTGRNPAMMNIPSINETSGNLNNMMAGFNQNPMPQQNYQNVGIPNQMNQNTNDQSKQQVS
jgi:hypothetical protein